MRNRTTGGRQARLCAAILAVAALGACRGSPRDVTRRDRTKIRVASQAYLGNAPMHIGVHDSIFAAHGLDVEIVPLGGSDALPLLLSGDIDVVTATLSPGALNAMAGGQLVRVVAARGIFNPTRCSHIRMMKARSTASLRRGGRRSISVDRDLSMQYLVEASLQRAGVQIDTMQVLYIPGAAELDAFRKGTLDYALMGEPWSARAREEGHAEPWISIDSTLSGAVYGFILFGPSILSGNRELGERYVAAYLNAVSRYQEGLTPRNLEIVATVTGETPELLKKACWPSVSSDGRIRLEDVDRLQQWALARGYIKKAATPGQLWDSSFIAAVASRSPRTGVTP